MPDIDPNTPVPCSLRPGGSEGASVASTTGAASAEGAASAMTIKDEMAIVIVDLRRDALELIVAMNVVNLSSFRIVLSDLPTTDWGGCRPGILRPVPPSPAQTPSAFLPLPYQKRPGFFWQGVPRTPSSRPV